VFLKAFFALFVAVIVIVTVAAIPDDDGRATAADAEAAALKRVGGGIVQPARIEDDEWEVDVERHDGSLVEVTFDHKLHFRDIDEELGPGGTIPEDEVRGALRRKAIAAAFEAVGPGAVRTVERDAWNEIEVNVRRRNGTQIEVELDQALRVGEVEEEDPGDE
jgi:hypothetical protein